MKNLFQSFKALCFPSSCLLCGIHLSPASDVLLCPSCSSNIPYISSPLCRCCGIEFKGTSQKDHLCGNCLKKHPAFEKARAVLRYNDHTAKLVHRFKYSSKTDCYSTFSSLANSSLAIKDLALPDLIIPVPLHRKRLQERGFNQALVLALLFFPRNKSLINPMILVRSRQTKPQTGLSGKDRRKNLKNAFTVNKPDTIKRKKILLVDDVFTTGTTLHESARTLKKHGAVTVQALTLTRVVG